MQRGNVKNIPKTTSDVLRHSPRPPPLCDEKTIFSNTSNDKAEHFCIFATVRYISGISVVKNRLQGEWFLYLKEKRDECKTMALYL